MLGKRELEMKNTKRLVAILIAAVLVIVGVALAAVGLSGRKIYDEATAVLGCKPAETINYILDPSTITEIEDELSAGQYVKFMTGRLGLDSAEVEGAANAYLEYSAAAKDARNKDNFIAYVMEAQGLTEDEATELQKDKEQAAPIQNQMIAEALGCDIADVENQTANANMIALLGTGFENLRTNNGLTTTLFNNAILFMFIGLILLVAGAVMFFVIFVGGGSIGGKKKGRGFKPSPQAVTVGTFFLNYALYIILGLILLVVCIARPDFLNATNFLNILKMASTKGILALGCAGLIVLAGTDLSIGRVLGLSAAMTAAIVQDVTYSARMFPQITSPLPLIIPLLASICVAVIFALINGFGVAKLHLHAFIVTLGTQLIAQGLCSIFIESQPSGTAQALSTFQRGFLDFSAGNLTIGGLRIPNVVIYFVIIAIIMWVIWNKTRLGKNMFAVGGNTEAAAVSGVNVAKTIILVYLIAGILYGTSAFLEAGRITSVGANTGLNYETDAISACVVGGVSFSGGVGTIQGVVIGAIILQAINYSLQFLGVNPYLQYVIRGLIIILAVSIDVRKYIAKK